jgi:DNA-binding NarL/FixJ family response regulator
MRVLVVDDSLIVRQGLSHMLEAAGVSVVGQLDGPATLMSRVKMDRPDVVLLDIRMPPTHTTEGILAAEQLRSVYPELAVLVLSQFVEPSYALRLLHDHPEGMGYLLKDRIHDPAVLIDALRRLTESETVVDPTIVARLLGRKRVKDPLEVLSMREREILALVAEGLANRAIADRLSITDRTVEAHVARIFVKLDLSEDPCSNRRILAVLTYLRAEAV